MSCMFFACNNGVKNNTCEQVSCNPDIVTEDILTSDLFSDATLIPLDSTVVIGSNPDVSTGQGDLYIADYFLTKKIYRTNSTGRLINCIGELGKGSKEYLSFSDFEINTDTNHAIVYSGIDGKKYTYTCDGEFVGVENLDQPFYKAKQSENGTWVYLGYANPHEKGRVVKIGSNAKIITESLDAKYKVMAMDEITPVFHKNGDYIYMRETVSNIIHRIKDSDVEPLYEFDFDKYSIPDEYFKQSSDMDAMQYLFSRDFATIKKFMQNDDYAIVEVFVQRTNRKHTTEIGVKNIKDGTWRWFNIKTDNESTEMLRSGVATLTDNNEVLFIVDANDVINYGNKSVFKNSDIISNLTSDNNPVIIKCKL